MRVGIADHLGWAVAVSAASDGSVVDRRRLELVEHGLPAAPVHHDGGPYVMHHGGTSLSLRTWPVGFPTDIATQRRVPFEARADAIMYRQILAELGSERGWRIHLYDAKTVEVELARLLGERTEGILRRPREDLGPPWSKDHRVSLAATILAGEANSTRNVEGLPR